MYGKEKFSAVFTQVLQDLFRLNTSLVFAQPFSSAILLSFPFQIFSKLQMELGKAEKNIFRKMVTHKNLYINAFLSF